MKKKALYLAIPLALGLTACGGGSGTSASGPGFVSVLVTDAITTQFNKVWVTITKVTVQDSAGTVITLFDDVVGQVFNLTELKGVSNLLGSKQLPAGSYSNLTITMKPDVTLYQPASKIPVNATIDNPTQTIPGTFSVSGGNTSIGIDFDLANFNYTPPTGGATTGTVSSRIVMRSHQKMQKLAQAYAEVEGTLKSVTNPTDFIMTLGNGTDITVSLLNGATVLVDRAATGNTSKPFVDNNTAELKRYLGKPLEVYGNYDVAALTIEAIRVRAASSDFSTTLGPDKIEGLVTKSDNATGTFIDIREANFTAPASLLIKLGNPTYEKGKGIRSGQCLCNGPGSGRDARYLGWKPIHPHVS